MSRWRRGALGAGLLALALDASAQPAEIRGKVTAVEGDILMLDVGESAGLAPGDTGEVSYELRIGRAARSVVVASIRIEDVRESTATARVTVRKTEAEIQPGYDVRVETRGRQEAQRLARDKEAAEQERRRADEALRLAEEQRRRAEGERRRAEQAQRDAEEARRRAEDERRAAEARRGSRERQIVPREERGMMWIEGGMVPVGADDGDAEARETERPQREVSLRGFWMDKHEVSNERYRAFVDGGGYARREWWGADGWEWRERARATSPRYWQEPRFNAPSQPVVGVSWYEASAFCRSEGKRLPTEEEWEAAARGVDGRKYPWGNRWDRSRASTAQGSGDRPHPVGQYPNGASPFGVLDMAGNVWEWTASPFRPYPGGVVTSDYESRDARTARGGAWNTNPFEVRATNRQGRTPDYRSNSLGLRCARN